MEKPTTFRGSHLNNYFETYFGQFQFYFEHLQ